MARSLNIFKPAGFGLFCLSLLVFACFIGSCKNADLKQKMPVKVLAIETQVIPTPTPILTEKDQIIAEIIKVFGENSDKAFLLLLGKDNSSCAENRMLDPKAVNNNVKWGGVGRDCGIFQVNDYYHPYSCEEMKNWKLNISYAYRMYVNDNYTFIRWTCGKEYEI